MSGLDLIELRRSCGQALALGVEHLSLPVVGCQYERARWCSGPWRLVTRDLQLEESRDTLIETRRNQLDLIILLPGVRAFSRYYERRLLLKEESTCSVDDLQGHSPLRFGTGSPFAPLEIESQ